MLSDQEIKDIFLKTNSHLGWWISGACSKCGTGPANIERFAREIENYVMEKYKVQMEDNVSSNSIASKPEIGIMPERIWKETRVFDLIRCLARKYKEQNLSEDQYVIWLDELRRLLTDIFSTT